MGSIGFGVEAARREGEPATVVRGGGSSYEFGTSVLAGGVIQGVPWAMHTFIVYGAGGFGREVAWLAGRCGHQVVAFADDAPTIDTLRGVPVIAGIEAAMRRFPGASVALAIGDSSARELMADRALACGAVCPPLVDPSVIYDAPTVTIGEGALVCACAMMTVDITIGRFANVNAACTIGHDAVLADFATLGGSVNVSGHVRVERSAYVGSGSTIINGTAERPLVVGAQAIVGAHACVVRAVEANTTVVGVPAKPRPMAPHLAAHGRSALM